MAIQYYMRAYNTVTQLYVDWVVNDQPDSTGTFAPGGSANLTNITVNRVVTSKVGNFLNPAAEPTFISPNYTNPADAYLIHLNSYDWLNPSPPSLTTSTPPPTQPIGLAVVRGTTNGTTLRPYSSLFWDENTQQWIFAFVNANGTQGAAESVSMGITNVVGYLGVQDLVTDPESSTGLIRIPDNQFIKSRNNGNTGDVFLIGADTSSRVQVGSTTDPVYVPGVSNYLRVDGFLSNGDPTLVSASGFIRNPVTATIITAKGSGPDITLLSNSANLITLGDAVNTGIVYNTSTGHEHYFEVNSVDGIHIGSNYVTFDTADTNPLINQANTGGTNGNTFTVQAQNATTNGGLLVLTSGAGTTAGNINLQTGGVTREIVTSTGMTQLTSTYAFGGTADAVNVANPTIKQDDLSITGTGQTLTVQAQNATGSASVGGALHLTSGTGTTTAGNVQIQTGAVNQIIVSPTPIAPGSTPASGGSVVIAGNLEVVGTTTTIDSTVVDIEGRVVHGNWTVSTVVRAPIVPAGDITGYTINRGSPTGTGPTSYRDSAGLIYTEITDIYTDGYWKHATVLQDNDTNAATTALVATMPVMGAAYFATPNPNNEVPATKAQLPTTGGFRSLNNTTAVSSRNALTTQDLKLIGTDSSNHIQLGEITTPENAGFQFYTTTGSLYDFFVNNTSEVQISSDGNGPFVRESNATLFPATTGFVRTYNNVTTVAARNAGNTQDLLLLGTDSGNHVVMGASSSPQNAGFIFNTTTGSLYNFEVNSITQVELAGVFASATSAATTGIVRIPSLSSQTNTPIIVARNNGNTADIDLLSTNNTDKIIMGEPSGTPTNTGFIFNTSTGNLFDYWTNGVSEVQLGSDVNGPFVRESSTSFVPALTGFVRVPNNITAVTARNAGNTADLNLIGTDNSNHILHGNPVASNNAGHIFSTTSNSIFDFWVNGSSTVSIGADEINFTSADGYATIRHSPVYTNDVTGGSLTIWAQDALGANTIGGALVLNAGSGTLLDGYIDMQVGGVTVAAVEPNKFTFVQGRRRHVTQITGTYNVQLTDDYIAITSLIASFNVFMPQFPFIGDAYEFKDTTGNAGTFPVTIFGNGANIDASATFTLNQPYASVVLTYTGTTWSVS